MRSAWAAPSVFPADSVAPTHTHARTVREGGGGSRAGAQCSCRDVCVRVPHEALRWRAGAWAGVRASSRVLVWGRGTMPTVQCRALHGRDRCGARRLRAIIVCLGAASEGTVN
ncbi:uncharacterized protein Tco025E_06015 [Trypanosoma conorhini]|uniref:Uncharacterized protein n=1 Tax=Trypanosoma conorhini TaxID=83891 RepID=A0A3R7KV00_9TRYP|nr:uncharacterized protein Tco025E_06015 [Trypanosoma conorhini]RNF13932.1 hypothetical protein Tco025E_06015 [Trypanosoma conorhini]